MLICQLIFTIKYLIIFTIKYLNIFIASRIILKVERREEFNPAVQQWQAFFRLFPCHRGRKRKLCGSKMCREAH